MTEERWTRGPRQRIYSRTVTGRVSSSMSPQNGKTLIYSQIKLVYVYIKLIKIELPYAVHKEVNCLVSEVKTLKWVDFTSQVEFLEVS